MEVLGIMKKMMVILSLLFFVLGSIFAQGFGEKMAQNLADMMQAQQLAMQKAAMEQKEAVMKELLAKKISVIVFFAERLSPSEASERFGNTDDRTLLVQQVVEAYKDFSHRQLHWLQELSKTRSLQGEIENLTLHELCQAASLDATVAAIEKLAEQPEIDKICLYSQELTKPDAFFLTPEYYQIKDVKITPIANGLEKEVPASAIKESTEREITPEQIINILKKVFEYIKENKPVVNTSVDMACAIPKGIENWQQMANWREKHTGQYSIEYVNGFGITVVKILVRAHFYYNGSYNNIGKYITCATSTIDTLNVLWGYTLNATAQIPDSGIVNVGTSQDPVAGMKMFIHWTVDTILQHQEGRLTFSLDGNGNVSGY